MSLDPRSDKVALYYTGNDSGEPSMFGIPARDLTENDIARELFVRHGGKTLSGAAESRATDALLDELTAGPYRRTKPEPDKPADKTSPAAAPVSGTEE